jgi:hypothetical protein
VAAPPAPERLRAQQAAFTAYLRDPLAHPAPAGVDGRRVAVYRDLVYRNSEGLLRGGFPVLHAVLGATPWAALVRDFIARHRCQTPYFPALGEEFVRYLQDTRGGAAGDPPFLLELAHYEWVELALDVADIDVDWQRIDPHGDLLDGLPVMSPAAWSLAYRYPVHRIGPACQPRQAPPEPTFLLVYRDRQERVRFMELNAVTARLLAIVAGGEVVSGRQALARLAGELAHPEPAQLAAFGGELLRDLRAGGAILGSLRQAV